MMRRKTAKPLSHFINGIESATYTLRYDIEEGVSLSTIMGVKVQQEIVVTLVEKNCTNSCQTNKPSEEFFRSCWSQIPLSPSIRRTRGEQPELGKKERSLVKFTQDVFDTGIKIRQELSDLLWSKSGLILLGSVVTTSAQL
jgi:hypothetical protein